MCIYMHGHVCIQGTKGGCKGKSTPSTGNRRPTPPCPLAGEKRIHKGWVWKALTFFPFCGSILYGGNKGFMSKAWFRGWGYSVVVFPLLAAFSNREDKVYAQA